MPYNQGVDLNHVREFLSYDPETGELRWAKSPSKNVFVGELAGCAKATRTDKDGNAKSYRYIRILGENIPAARIAWALHNGEWPQGRVEFVDGDPLNLRAANLQATRGLKVRFDHKTADGRREYLKAHREEYGRDWKDWDLRKKFNISLHDYGEMLLAQEGKCAICGSRDAGTRNGEKKSLAVDHCHDSGKVRGLLCEACNQGLGKFGDNPDVLRAAADYIDRHKKDC